jgi:hypothetical protein
MAKALSSGSRRSRSRRRRWHWHWLDAAFDDIAMQDPCLPYAPTSLGNLVHHGVIGIPIRKKIAYALPLLRPALLDLKNKRNYVVVH